MDYPLLRMPSFNFWASWSGTFEGFGCYDRGTLITWIIWYVFDGPLPQVVIDYDDGEYDKNDRQQIRLIRAFKFIVEDIDKQMQRYQEYLNNKNQ